MRGERATLAAMNLGGTEQKGRRGGRPASSCSRINFGCFAGTQCRLWEFRNMIVALAAASRARLRTKNKHEL